MTPAQAYEFIARNKIDWDILKGSPYQMPPIYKAVALVPGNHKMLINARKFHDVSGMKASPKALWQMDKRLLKAFKRAQDALELRAAAAWLKSELRRRERIQQGNKDDDRDGAKLAAIKAGATKLAVTKDHLDGKVDMTPDQQSWVKSVGRSQIWVAIN